MKVSYRLLHTFRSLCQSALPGFSLHSCWLLQYRYTLPPFSFHKPTHQLCVGGVSRKVTLSSKSEPWKRECSSMLWIEVELYNSVVEHLPIMCKTLDSISITTTTSSASGREGSVIARDYLKMVLIEKQVLVMLHMSLHSLVLDTEGIPRIVNVVVLTFWELGKGRRFSSWAGIVCRVTKVTKNCVGRGRGQWRTPKSRKGDG